MIHYRSALDITDRLYEVMSREGGDFAFAAIEAELSEYPGRYAAWHWHDYVELAYAAEGAVEICTPRHRHVLQEGEGYYVNANVLHTNRVVEGRGCLRVLQFDTALLSNCGRIAQNYIGPLERSARLECVKLSTEDCATADMLKGMSRIFDTAAREPVGFEMEIVSGLYRLWQQLFCAVGKSGPEETAVTGVQTERLKAMLAFIHVHYAEPLSMEDIAASASLSPREAHRTFRQVLDTTPGAYLQQHRLRQASRLLLESPDSITEIGLRCGFSSPNYFCSAFKAAMGMPPRAYRKGKNTIQGANTQGRFV